MASHSTRGTHFLLDIWHPKEDCLNDLGYLQYVMDTAVHISKATVLSKQHHQFEPLGLTIVYLLQESHISIHTYPEQGYAAIDLFTCGNIQPKAGMQYMLDALKPSSYELKEIQRGIEQ